MLYLITEQQFTEMCQRHSLEWSPKGTPRTACAWTLPTRLCPSREARHLTQNMLNHLKLSASHASQNEDMRSVPIDPCGAARSRFRLSAAGRCVVLRNIRAVLWRHHDLVGHLSKTRCARRVQLADSWAILDTAEHSEADRERKALATAILIQLKLVYDGLICPIVPENGYVVRDPLQKGRWRC